ncbi:MAG TPA: deoxyribose-phosphate aldolase [Pirellulales bacterium]|nr:deoxyribose-phosphate aldolase [Pirellulales bacterium]
MSDYTYEQIAKLIDHSLLDPTLTDEALEAGCQLARRYNVASVCIKPYYLARCVELLAGSTVEPSTTIGFPHGAQTTAIKRHEAEEALGLGATELDMVINIGKALSGDWHYVAADIRSVVDAAHERGKLVKVILENCYLNDEQKIRLCQICGELRADFVKTSTGYGSSGATHDDLRLMRAHSPPTVRVKAAGGVRTFDQLLAVRALGVSRIGASRTAEILDECRRRLS